MAIDFLLVFQRCSSSQKLIFTLLLGVAIGYLANYVLLSGAGDLLVLDGGRPVDHVRTNSTTVASVIVGK
jgi:hypothetical protein